MSDKTYYFKNQNVSLTQCLGVHVLPFARYITIVQQIRPMIFPAEGCPETFELVSKWLCTDNTTHVHLYSQTMNSNHTSRPVIVVNNHIDN